MLEKKLPRCWRKSSPNVYKSCPKSSNSSFYMWVKFSTLLKKLQIIWASFDRTFVAKNFNLVTLVGREKNKQQMNVWGAEICKANWNFVFYLFKWGGGRQPASLPPADRVETMTPVEVTSECWVNNWRNTFRWQWRGSAGRAVASDTICSRFESSHRQILCIPTFCQLDWKVENR